ncbi:MAG TPA: carboxypeptidase-like regulatory domain-containing protein, partial [Terriglobia bacterium]|nr:carboxypeptidase-like regulatory domain-containing protein [Terriglobia bacterium]
MKTGLVLAMLIFAVAEVRPQEKPVYNGVIQGRVTHPGGKAGVPETQVVLEGPIPASGGGVALRESTPFPEETISVTGARTGVGAAAAQRGVTDTTARDDIDDAGAMPVTVTLTDTDGRFSFRKLAPGNYTVRVQREGYFGTLPRGVSGLEAPLTLKAEVTIIPGYTPADISFDLVEGGVISGHLRDPNGRLLTNYTISAYQTAYKDGRGILKSIKSAQTDDRGEYRLFWLPPGSYLVAVDPRRPGPLPSPSDAYARTFYPGLIDARLVPPVIVTDGGEVSAIDILVRAEATATISGRVLAAPESSSESLSPASSQLTLVPRDVNALLASGDSGNLNVKVNRLGRFEIRNVLPGSYDLIASAAEGAARGFWGRTRVDVGTVNLDDVTIEVRPGVELRARLRIDGKEMTRTTEPAPAPGVSDVAAPASPPAPDIQLSLQPAGAAMPGADRAANANVTVDPSGMFVFPSVPEGRYRFLAADLPPNAY